MLYCLSYTTSNTENYTLSLHDALPIFCPGDDPELEADDLHHRVRAGDGGADREIREEDAPRQSQSPAEFVEHAGAARRHRSEEHTSELQSHSDLVCRLLLEKKNITHNY